jgi:H-NS histone family
MMSRERPNSNAQANPCRGAAYEIIIGIVVRTQKLPRIRPPERARGNRCYHRDRPRLDCDATAVRIKDLGAATRGCHNGGSGDQFRRARNLVKAGTAIDLDGPPNRSQLGSASRVRNPDNPAETWAGRGLKPRWLTAAIKFGKKVEDFLMAGSAASKANGRKKANGGATVKVKRA